MGFKGAQGLNCTNCCTVKQNQEEVNLNLYLETDKEESPPRNKEIDMNFENTK